MFLLICQSDLVPVLVQLGLTRSALSCREAVSNFLMALSQQRRSQRCSHQQMSANIWAALRIAISMMDQPELFQAANVGDLDLLMKAFDVGDI